MAAGAEAERTGIEAALRGSGELGANAADIEARMRPGAAPASGEAGEAANTGGAVTPEIEAAVNIDSACVDAETSCDGSAALVGAALPEAERDAEVERALHCLATGYKERVKKVYKLRRVQFDDRGRKEQEWEELAVGEDEVFVAPNVTAQKFWLAKRLPRQWGDGATGGEEGAEIIDDIPEGSDGA